MRLRTIRLVSVVVGSALRVLLGMETRAEQPPTAMAPGTGCRIVWARPVADAELSAGVHLGGLSDLVPARDGSGRFWTITDRGPNGIIERNGEKLRTLLHPDFAPCLVLLRVDPLEPSDGAIAVERVVPLAAPGGKPLSGRPIGGSHQLPVLVADGSADIDPDPDGVDTEAVAVMKDGSSWVAEEYGPSLLKVSPEGVALERHLPAGVADAAAKVPCRETIPGEYASRRDNRGFEALALAPDDSKLFVLLQSPLDHPAPKAAKKSGNVRLVVFDPKAGCMNAELLYRLGDPADPDYLTKGAPPDDGKLCCMAAFGKDGLLVLEQDDEGLARLYAVTLQGATDTRGWKPKKTGDAEAIEEVRDLPKAGIVPVAKRLVADLSPLREAMAATADGGELQHGLLKLEGLAIVDDTHVLLVDDDDFGVHGKGDDRRRSYLWLLELDSPLGTATREPARGKPR